MNYSLHALESYGCPIPLRLWSHIDGDRRSSTDGKEIITGDTVGGDDTPQIPQPQDDKK